jgi:hypothetical protein
VHGEALAALGARRHPSSRPLPRFGPAPAHTSWRACATWRSACSAAPAVNLTAALRYHARDPARPVTTLGITVDESDITTERRNPGDLQTVKQLGDRLAQASHPLKLRTLQLALGELEAAGLAAGSEEGNGRTRYCSPAIAYPDADNAGDDQGGDGGGEGMA